MANTYSNTGMNAPHQNQQNMQPRYVNRNNNIPNNNFPQYPQPVYLVPSNQQYNYNCYENMRFLQHGGVIPNMVNPESFPVSYPAGQFQNVFQNLVQNKPQDIENEGLVRNEQSVRVNFKNAISQTVVDETVEKPDIKNIQSSFIHLVSSAAHKSNGSKPKGVFVEKNDSGKSTPLPIKVVEESVKIEKDSKTLKDAILSTELSEQSLKEEKVDAIKPKITVEVIIPVNVILETPNSVPVLKPDQSSQKIDNVSSLPVSKVTNTGISRISYVLGDLLEWSCSKDSMTLKSLNAITKYVVCFTSRVVRAKKVSYKRSEDSFISHAERINNLSDSQATLEKFKIIVRTSLNKLTAQNISFVHDQLASLNYKIAENSDFLSECLVRSVTKNMLLIVHYAHLSAKLIESVDQKKDGDISEIIKTKISARCIKNLQVDPEWVKAHETLKSRKISSLSEHDILNEELLELEETQRKVHLGTITFLSHLLKLRVFGQELAIKALDILNSDTHEFSVEMLCKYLTVYGMELEEISKTKINDVFKRITVISPDCTRRLQFLLEDVVALHKNHWKTGASDFRVKKFVPLRSSEPSIYTPQRSNGPNKPNISVFNNSNSSLKSFDVNRQHNSYSSANKYTGSGSGKGFSTVRQNKYGSLANDVSEPEIQTFTSKKHSSSSQKFSSYSSNQRNIKSNPEKSKSTSNEPVFAPSPVTVVDTPKAAASSTDNIEMLKKTFDQIIFEYSLSLDTSVVLGRMTEFDIVQYMKFFIEVAFTVFIERKTTGHRFLGNLLVLFFQQKRIDKKTLFIGFEKFCAYAQDAELEVDVPMMWNFVDSAMCPLIYSGDLTIFEYIELIKSSGFPVSEDVFSRLFNVIVSTTSKKTLYLLCKNKEVNSVIQKSEILKREFPYLVDSFDNLDEGVALQNVFSISSSMEINSNPYTFEKGKVNSQAVVDYSRIVYSRCPSGPCELIKSYTENLRSVLKDSCLSSLGYNEIVEFFNEASACVKSQNRNPSTFLLELIRTIAALEIIDESQAEQMLSTSEI